METQKIYTGSKFFKYNDNEEADMLRVIKEDEVANIIYCKDREGHKYKISRSDLLDNYTMLKPDGVLNISIVELEDSSDVIVALANIKKPEDGPFAICRQSIYDFYTNDRTPESDYQLYLGISTNKYTCPANIDFKCLTACNSIKDTRFINVYLDDTLDNILDIIRTKRYDTVLRQVHMTMDKIFTNKAVFGCNDTLKDLLVDNNFMYDFRSCFDIFEFDSPIGDRNCLDAINLDKLEKDYHVKNVMKTYVLPYTKEVDLSKVVKKYFLAASKAEDYKPIYIVAYDTTDELK